MAPYLLIYLPITLQMSEINTELISTHRFDPGLIKRQTAQQHSDLREHVMHHSRSVGTLSACLSDQ